MKTLIDAVQNNCHISDARHAGNYSLCVFLLKMREYYRWESQIPLTQQLAREKVGEWMAQREQHWAGLEHDNYGKLPLNGDSLDPFAADDINAALVPQGYVYSSGYGVFRKPHFFIGQLHSTRKINGYTVYIASRELARDLVAPPAMVLQQNIFIRQESLRRFIWEKIEEWQWKEHPDTPIGRILQNYGNGLESELLLDKLVQEETETLILHELGELHAGELLGGAWHDLFDVTATPKDEFIIRAIRDLIADCHTTLPTLLENGQQNALHFFFSNYNGLRRSLFPQLSQAYEQAVATGNNAILHTVVRHGEQLWLKRARVLLDALQRDKNQVTAMLENIYQEHNIQ